MGGNLQNLKKYKLGELVEFKYGKGLPERDRVPGDYPVYGSGGIVGTHKEALVRGPGIIIGRKGSIGNVFYETNDFFPIDTVFYVNPHSKNIDLYYFSKLLAQIGFQNMNSDAAVPGLKRDLALSHDVLIHDYHDQLKISAILSAYDDLIENNLRRIKILEEMAQLIYREWFVHFRFPGHEKIKMVNSPLGKIPEGWKVKCLGDVTENFDKLRKPLSSMDRAKRNGLYPYYGAAKIIDYIDDYIFDGTYLLIAEDGSVITNEQKPVLQYVEGKFWANNHVHILKGKGIISTEHLYLALSEVNISGYITGAAQPKFLKQI
jgi:type I restriction enzyme, S subunit